MSIKNKEYACGIDKFKKPKTVEGPDAIGTRLMMIITMEPGDDPLHPEMGLGIKRYRYTIDTLDELEQNLKNQIATYLPIYQNVEISLEVTPDKLCNIVINIGDTRYIYDSNTQSKPISLDDIAAL